LQSYVGVNILKRDHY